MNVYHRSVTVFLLLVALLGQAAPTFAQQGGVIHLSPVEAAEFPSVQIQMDVYDEQGRFVSQLGPDNVQILEDGKAIQPDTINPVRNGLQIILALNLGPTLAKQTDGITVYERIQFALIDWARQQDNPVGDDYSFATPTGLYTIRSSEPDELVSALTDYQPDLQKTQPSLNSLVEALDLATDPLNDTSMKRTILYITPPLDETNQAPLADLAARAREIGVRVNIWIIQSDPQAAGSIPITGTENAEETPVTLQTLSETTGGQYIEILPTDPIPEVETFFAPLRSSYRIEYTSAAQRTGTHQLVVQVNQENISLTSDSQAFSLTVEPPNPIFLSPPSTIERTWTKAEKNQLPQLIPAKVPMQILVEFPDQHNRDLTATRLYLDGKLVDENTKPPFDEFSLPLADIQTTSTHALRLEVVDVLGLSGTSVEVPLDIVVEQPVKASLFQKFSERGLIAIGAMLFSGLALALVLTSGQRWARRKRSALDRKRMKDPVTQPVKIRQEKPRQEKSKPAASKSVASRPAWAPAGWQSAAWPRPSAPSAAARLVLLDENEQPITGGVVLLSRQEITFGSDPRRATQVLESPTVAELHARLYRTEEGRFCLCDQNSIAGTWVNYAPVTTAGTTLEHNDLIHIGKVMFRFELTDPSKIPATDIKVVHLEKHV